LFKIDYEGNDQPMNGLVDTSGGEMEEDGNEKTLRIWRRKKISN